MPVLVNLLRTILRHKDYEADPRVVCLTLAQVGEEFQVTDCCQPESTYIEHIDTLESAMERYSKIQFNYLASGNWD